MGHHIAVSSANVAISVLLVTGKSEVCNKYKTGPRTLSCGTPDNIGTRNVENSIRMR